MNQRIAKKVAARHRAPGVPGAKRPYTYRRPTMLRFHRAMERMCRRLRRNGTWPKMVATPPQPEPGK